MNDAQKEAAVAAIYGFPIRPRRAVGSLREQGIIKGSRRDGNWVDYELQSPYAVGIVDGKPWVGKVFEVRRA